MFRRLHITFLLVVLLSITPLTAASQGMPPMPATPVPGEAPVGTLAEFNLSQLATPHAEVWFIRMGLDPGGSVPIADANGPVILYVETGELSLEIDGFVMMPGADRGEEPGELTMAAGDSLQITREATATLHNDTDAPVVFLGFLMYPAETEGQGDQNMADPVGLSQMGISVGTAEFMDVPATVRMERIVVKPGETIEPELDASAMQMPGYMGMELGAVETGSAEVTLENAGMANLTWPGMLDNQMGEPVRGPMTATVTLGTSDAYAFHGSILTWMATGDEPLTILRVVITPEMGQMGE
jgi:hypothetical protein